jgi:putative membrane protein
LRRRLRDGREIALAERVSASMIRGYSEHSANERTFLAWLRTSIAVIAFGFVVEKFNLFALTLLDSTSLDDAHRMRLERLSGSLPQGAGRAFIVVGVITIVLATIRFVRTGWLLDDTAVHTPSILPDLIFSVILAAMLIALSAYLVIW